MLETERKTKKLAMVTVLFLSVFSIVLLPRFIPNAGSSYTNAVKPMEFYLHYTDIPVTAAGLQTKHVFNTTRLFRFLTQDEAYANSFYKPLGLPKIDIDFYLYPNLAGSVTLDGNWQVFIWVNGSAYKPVTFTVDFKEVNVGGATLWDSGQLSPTVTSSIGSYIDVPVYCYNLSVPLTHTFNPESTILVEVEVNSGSVADTRIWYDSPLYPSKVILPAKDYARATWIKTYSVDNSETKLFCYNWSENHRVVIVRANVTDPFGGYDVYKVNATIFDPEGNAVIDNVEMTRVSNGHWSTNYANIFEVNWSYPSTTALGNYSVVVSVIDNNGHYHNLDNGFFEPFIEEETCGFTMGVIVYYNPVFQITDDVNEPLPNAQVYITWRNGTTDTSPRYTTTGGLINLTRVSAGNYGFTILWKDKIVQQTTVYVDSNGPYTIKTQVYQLTVRVLGNNGAPVHGAYVIVYTQSGIGYGLDTTNVEGTAVFKLPSGTYRVEAYYTSDYWLTVVRDSAVEQVSVTASTSKDVALMRFPPAMWSTIGFWIIMGAVIAIVTVAVFVFQMSYKKMHIRA